MSALHRPLALLLALLVTFGLGCSSDSRGSGGDSGTAIDTGFDVDLSVDFGLPDGGGDVDDDSGYRSDTAGQDCFDQQDCESGEVCVGADPANGNPGYCSILDCEDHPECNFGIDDAVFCCSDFGAFRGCFRESEEAVCGDGGGQQGDDCSSGGQSDCAGESFYCIDLFGDQICSGQCDPRDPTSCSGDSWCYPTGGGSGLCIASGETPNGQSCAAEPGSCESGAVCDGGFSDPPTATAFCASLCTRTRDCAATEWCRIYPGQGVGTCIPEGDGEQGSSCAEDRWACEAGLYCSGEGTRYAICAQLCQRARDCDDGFECDFFSDQLGACHPVGDRETGEPCGDDPFACIDGAVCIGVDVTQGYNPDAYCSESCAINPTACGDDFFCESFGDSGSFCLPDGEAGPGDACTHPTDCEADTVCLYNRVGDDGELGRCQRNCVSDGQCGEGGWCTGGGQGGVCLEDGNLDVGETCADDPFGCPEESFCGGNPPTCITGCDDDDDCPSSFYCPPGGPDQDRFCAPFGDRTVGQSCDAPDDCEQGSFCAFLGEESAGVCSHGCSSDGDCPTDLWCLRSPLLSVCVPEGATSTGGSCADDRFACQAGHVCLLADSDAAYCARDCTGFVDRCADDEVCRWVGSGLSLCVTVGEIPVGGDCADDPTACQAGSTCLDPDQEDAACVAICTFDSDVCDGDTECEFTNTGVGLCR